MGKQNHFPYHCPKSHCILSKERCENKCCMEGIAARIKEFRGVISRNCVEEERLLAEIEGLNKDRGYLWERVDQGHPEALKLRLNEECDVPWERVAHEHLKNESGSPYLYGLCKPWFPAEPCTSCVLESLFRKYQSLRMSIAVRQEQLRTRHEYDTWKKNVEDEVKVSKQQEKMSRVEGQFSDLKVEIAKLAAELELLSGEQPRYHTDFLITIEDSNMAATTMMLQTDGCSCKRCILDRKICNYEMAVVHAKQHKRRLSREIEHRQSIQSNLRFGFERLQVREDGDMTFEFDRTGSYRGFGAGALKPRRETNPNSQPVGKNEGDEKTTKKSNKKHKKSLKKR